MRLASSPNSHHRSHSNNGGPLSNHMRKNLEQWERAVWAELRERVDQVQLDGDPHTRMWMLDVISEQVQEMQKELVGTFVDLHKFRLGRSAPTHRGSVSLPTGR